MNINLKQPIYDIDGKTALDKHAADFIAEALYTVQLSPEFGESYKQCKLADRVRDGEKNYTAEEIATMKQVVGRKYAPIIVGQVIDILEGETEG